MTIFSQKFRDRLLPIALSQAVGVACGAAGVKIVSHIVSPKTLGVYGIFLTLTTLGMWLVHSGLVKFIGRQWAGSTDRGMLWESVQRSWRRKLPWLVAGTLAASTALWYFYHAPFVAIPALVVSAAALSLCAISQTALQAARQHWRDFVFSAFGSLSRTFGPLLVYLALARAAGGLYLGFCAHAVFVAIVGWLVLRPAKPANVSENRILPIYDGPFFFVLASASWTLTGLNRWLAAAFFGDTTAGFFTLAANIATILPAVLSGIFVQYLQPSLYRLADDAEADWKSVLARMTDWAALGLAVIGLGALVALKIAAPFLVGVLIDPKYLNSLDWILPAGCFALASFVAYFYHLMLLASRKESACAPVDLSTATVLIAGSIVCAALGENPFRAWLIVSPLVVPIITRPLARRYLRNPA